MDEYSRSCINSIVMNPDKVRFHLNAEINFLKLFPALSKSVSVIGKQDKGGSQYYGLNIDLFLVKCSELQIEVGSK